MLHRKIVFFILMLFATSVAMAGHVQRHQIVDGISVYFGAIPAQMIDGHGSMHYPENKKLGRYSYHLLVALMDAKSGQRIKDASVTATVIPVGMHGETKKLEPMHGDVVSYGNFFDLPDSSPYTIKVEIRRPGSDRTAVANFTFTRPRD